MKILGVHIPFTRKEKISAKDVVPELQLVLPGTKSPSKIPSVSDPVIKYAQIASSSGSRPDRRKGLFEQSEYDLYEIGTVEDVDSYVRQAFKKKVGLCLKEGFDFVGSNKRTVKYIETRFAQIAQATDIPHEELIRRLVYNFISKSNAFLIKVRNAEASGGFVRTDADGRKYQPVAGYFPAPAENMEVELASDGTPSGWRQKLPTGGYRKFRADDVIHFTFHKKEGFLFGTPTITPVIDDLRALRKMEENVELLVYKHIFPIFQYVVGTEKAPAGITESGRPEIAVVKEELQFMADEGAIVTPERHEIRMIGAEGRALRAESYLDHFKRRVFAGLGMSAVDYGESDTSNRSTADNMSRALVDDVKDFQDAFEAQFNHYVISELLLESSFKEDVLLAENQVKLVFREVDIDKQIKVENHLADLFAKHAITWDETRRGMSFDPIAVPLDGEDQDPMKFPEWQRTFWKLFQEPLELLKAGAFSAATPAAFAAASSPGSGITAGAISQAQASSEKLEKAKKPPKPVSTSMRNVYDSVLIPDWATMRASAMQTQHQSAEDIKTNLYATATILTNNLRLRMMNVFTQSVNKLIPTHINTVHLFVSARNSINKRAELLVRRLVTDIVQLMRARLDRYQPEQKQQVISAIFDALEYRIHLIEETELKRAENLGSVMAARFMNMTHNAYSINTETCDNCKEIAKVDVDLRQHTMETVPPHHPHCTCQITYFKK